MAPSASCPVTKPKPEFRAPAPNPATPPAYYHARWYGTADLWTTLDRDGEVWHDLPEDADGLTQKTFWWSARWPYRSELEPAITVTGQRLDGPGNFRFGDPGTNASADFGVAMLVGVEVPTSGCWEITGTYRGSSLSFVALVKGN
jgi:hypothetical protein